MMGYKVYINYFLWRLGIRDVLPAPVINRVRVSENGEPLVTHKGRRMRRDVARRLKMAGAALPDGVSIKVLSGYRSIAEQKRLWKKTPDKRLVANPETGGGGHQTGGAVDVTLVDSRGRALDMGGEYLIFDAHTPTRAVKNTNREMLCRAMTVAGFQNYPREWWHFSYGDKIWAAYSRAPHAIYGGI